MRVTISNFWPADRIARYRALQKEARRRGLSLTIRNVGDRFVPIFLMRFKKDGQVIEAFSDISKAEKWMAGGAA